MKDESADNDTLSEVLDFCGLTGYVFCQANLAAPWGMRIPEDKLAHFHYMNRGSCLIRIEGQKKEYKISQGEIVVIPRGNAHALFDSQKSKAIPIAQALAKGRPRNVCPLIGVEDPDAEFQMICGAFEMNEGRQDMILSQLPDVMVLYMDDLRTKTLVETIMKFIVRESAEDEPGSRIAISRMVEILFIHLLRSWLKADRGKIPVGWMCALNDENLIHSLRAIHSRPQENWTVQKLASISNMSRSPFAGKFKKTVGESPLSYLTKWRMNIAADLLENGDPTIYEVASRVGYVSETSFSKAFKKYKGVTPARWKTR